MSLRCIGACQISFVAISQEMCFLLWFWNGNYLLSNLGPYRERVSARPLEDARILSHAVDSLLSVISISVVAAYRVDGPAMSSFHPFIRSSSFVNPRLSLSTVFLIPCG